MQYLENGRPGKLATLLLLAMLFAMCPTSTTLAEETAPPEYTIGLGDALEVHIWKEPELSRPVTVRLDGRISLPLLGDLQAAGMTIPNLTTELEKRYSKIIAEPAVTVMLQESRSRRYYVLGQVANAGEFPLDTPITVLQAIARCGGFREWAKTDNIAVIRRMDGQEKILKFNYDALVKGKDVTQNLAIAPGDTIVVP
jgi:polysaccharide export outer membrane protein